MSRLDALLLDTLRAHPHHDTLPQLLDAVRGPEIDGDAVADSLERMRAQGLLMTADGHWQLTARGWRLKRAA